MTDVEICNLALSHIGQGVSIASLTERSDAARACSAFFEIAKKQCLRDYLWPFASVKAYTLNLVEDFNEDTDSNSEWKFSYRYPSNCLFVRKIQNGLRSRSPDTDNEYEITHDSEGRLVLCDIEDAVIDYTKDITDYTLAPDDFCLTLSYLVASYIAPRLAKGEHMKLKKDMLALYKFEASSAIGNSRNEQRDAQDLDPEMIRAR